MPIQETSCARRPMLLLAVLTGAALCSICVAQSSGSASGKTPGNGYNVSTSDGTTTSPPSQPKVKYYILPNASPTIGPALVKPYDWIYKTNMSAGIRDQLSRDYQELYDLLAAAQQNEVAEAGQNLQEFGASVSGEGGTLPVALSVQDRWDRIGSLRDEIQQTVTDNNLNAAISSDALQQSLGYDSSASDQTGDLELRLQNLRREAAQADSDLNQAESDFEVLQSGGTYNNAPRPDQGSPATDFLGNPRDVLGFSSGPASLAPAPNGPPKNYTCSTGPCTLEEWQRSAKKSNAAQSGQLKPCQPYSQLGGYTPCSGQKQATPAQQPN